MTPPWKPQASKPSQRMKPKPGGLFDTGATGVSKANSLRLTSVDSLDFNFADEALDMYATLEKGDTEDNVTMATPLMSMGSDCSDLLSLDGDFDFSSNADLCEVFTDLTQILQEGGQEDMAVAIDDVPLPAVVAEPPTAGRRATKRRASQALPDDGLTPLVNHDHSDYTTKDKRRKTSPSAPSATVAVVTASSTAVAETSRSNKYIERRRKNNIASKRSRETRKQKHSALEQKAIELEAQNKALKLKVEQLEKLAQEMKDTLVNKLAHGK